MSLSTKQKSTLGFSLAEVILSMLILSIIGTFSINKLVRTQANVRQQSVMKETVATIEQVAYMYRINGYRTISEFDITKFINATKYCNTSALAQGCWVAGMYTNGVEELEPGFVLSNGAYVTGAFVNTSNLDYFHVDWNGPAGPNIMGQDTYNLAVCIDPNNCVTGEKFGTVRKNSGYQNVFQ